MWPMSQAYEVVGFTPGDSRHEGVELSIIDVTGLHSEAKCARQWRVHFDFGRLHVDPTDDFCVSMLFPLDDYASFYVRPGRDEEGVFLPWDSEAISQIYDEKHGDVPKLKKGQALVMHAGFGHAGWSSLEENNRLFLRLVTPHFKQLYQKAPNVVASSVFT